jgi:hypothetical protein
MKIVQFPEFNICADCRTRIEPTEELCPRCLELAHLRNQVIDMQTNVDHLTDALEAAVTALESGAQSTKSQRIFQQLNDAARAGWSVLHEEAEKTSLARCGGFVGR